MAFMSACLVGSEMCIRDSSYTLFSSFQLVGVRDRSYALERIQFNPHHPCVHMHTVKYVQSAISFNASVNSY